VHGVGTVVFTVSAQFGGPVLATWGLTSGFASSARQIVIYQQGLNAPQRKEAPPEADAPRLRISRPLGIRAEGGVTELFDVRVLPGVRRPTAAGFLTEEIHRAFTIEVE
jgi:hypothetical protein